MRLSRNHVHAILKRDGTSDQCGASVVCGVPTLHVQRDRPETLGLGIDLALVNSVIAGLHSAYPQVEVMTSWLVHHLRKKKHSVRSMSSTHRKSQKAIQMQLMVTFQKC